MSYIVPADNPLGVPSFEFDETMPTFYWSNTGRFGQAYNTNDTLYAAFYTRNNGTYFLIASQGSEYKWTFGTTSDPSTLVPNMDLGSTVQSYTNDGLTVYFASIGISGTLDVTNAPLNLSVNLYNVVGPAAWLMVYGGYTGFAVTYDLDHCTGDPDNPTTIQPNAVVTLAHFTADPGYYFSRENTIIYGTGTGPEGGVVFVFDTSTGEMRIGPVTSDITIKITCTSDPYDRGGNTHGGGGNGTFDNTTVPIDFPPLPTISATDAGFITLFNPSKSELAALADYMWNNPLFDLDTWKKIVADPMDAILGLSIVPVAVTPGTVKTLKIGNISTSVSMVEAARQFEEVDCGSLLIEENWGAYLDYDPYTKAEIYLPYIGTHALSADDVMGKTVHIKYHVDILTGACCVYIKCGDSVLYTFTGQCSTSVPIASKDLTNVVNGVLGAAKAVGSMVATGGASAPAQIPGLVSTATNALKPNIEKSGSMAGTAGMLAAQIPYLILTRPRQAIPADQNHFMGYPSFITTTLGNLSGYTEVETIHPENIPATKAEIAEIETLLGNGVIF